LNIKISFSFKKLISGLFIYLKLKSLTPDFKFSLQGGQHIQGTENMKILLLSCYLLQVSDYISDLNSKDWIKQF